MIVTTSAIITATQIIASTEVDTKQKIHNIVSLNTSARIKTFNRGCISFDCFENLYSSALVSYFFFQMQRQLFRSNFQQLWVWQKFSKIHPLWYFLTEKKQLNTASTVGWNWVALLNSLQPGVYLSHNDLPQRPSKRPYPTTFHNDLRNDLPTVTFLSHLPNDLSQWPSPKTFPIILLQWGKNFDL